MGKVGICGTFDYELHEEHRKFVEFASQFGSVVVFITSDETVIENKGRRPYFQQWQRVENVVQIASVYSVVKLSESSGDNFKTMMQSKLTYYVFGPDQNIENDKRLRVGFEEIGVEIIDWEYERQVFTSKLLKQDKKWDELQIEYCEDCKHSKGYLIYDRELDVICKIGGYPEEENNFRVPGNCPLKGNK